MIMLTSVILHVGPFENLRKNVEVFHSNPGLGWQRGFNKVNLVAQRK